MSTLYLSLLGPYKAILHGQPLGKFRTNKVQALLIYLATEASFPHRREALMALLWPGLPQKSAQVNLRQTLYQLRRNIPEIATKDGKETVPFLLSDRQTVQINPAGDLQLDLVRFQELLSHDSTPTDLTEAVALYRDDFLCDFFLPDSAEFEDWAGAKRPELRRQVLDALESLTDFHIEGGDYDQAQAMAWRALEIDNLREGAYCGLMTALAASGQRTAALAQYQVCRKRLQEELGVEPSVGTAALYGQIQADALRDTQTRQPRAVSPGVGMPVFLFTDIEGSTPLWETHRHAMLPALLAHNDILVDQIAQHSGRVLELRGDGVKAVFEGVDPLPCVLAIQQAFGQRDWGEVGEIRIRIGLHGVPQEEEGHEYFLKGDQYYGPALHHAARIMDAGHGGQILVSEQVRNSLTLPPSATWQDLGEHALKGVEETQPIFSLLHTDLPLQAFPPLRTLSAQVEHREPPLKLPLVPENLEIPRHNLPVQPTSFIGREEELVGLDALIADPDIRLITIVGTGGMGKTRLALACAERFVETQHAANLPDGDETRPYDFHDGIFFVDLAPLSEVDHIILAVAEALDIQFHGGEQEKRTRWQQLLDYLSDKQMLFIMDNFEHLLEWAGLVNDILQTASGVQVLVTSRERLQLRQEQLYPIPGLKFPDWETPEDAAEFTAVQLFLQAARRIRPSFELVAGDLTFLTRICRLVGGMPLALELAAGWVEMLSLADIATEIKRSLDFLETDLQDIPDRHRSMRAIFDSTWARLEPTERDMMQKFSVFRGGSTREAALQVAADQDRSPASLRLLVRLVSKSLLQVNPARDRYRIHELLRQYAQGRLEAAGELEAARTAHGRYYTDMVNGREAGIKGGRQTEALDEIEVDFANIHDAWKWALSQGNQAAIDSMLEALLWFCHFRSRSFEGVDLFQEAEAYFASRSGREANRLRRQVEARRIYLDGAAWLDDASEKLKEIENILAAARRGGDQTEIAFALFTYGLQQQNFDNVASLKSLKESLAIYSEQDDSFYESRLMDMISVVYLFLGKPEERESIARQRLELAQNTGDMWTMADALGQIGFVAEIAGRYAEAEGYYQEALPIFREFGDRLHISEYTSRLGEMAFLKGEFGRARELVTDGLALARQFNLPYSIPSTQAHLGFIFNAEEQYDQAAKFCQELALFTTQLSAFTGLRGMAYAMCGLEDHAAARHHLRKALEAAVSLKAPGWQAQCLPAAAIIAASEGQTERAAELLALAFHHPTSAAGWLEKFPLVTRLRASLKAELTPKVFAAAWERGQVMDLAETVAILLHEDLD